MRLVEGIARVDDVDAFVADLDAVATEHGVTVQAVDARYVVSRRHLERAVELADRERGRGAGIARDRAVEILLYATGRRQIDRALEMGVSDGETPVVVLVDRGPDEGGTGEQPAAEADPGHEEAAAAAVREHVEPAATLGAYDEELVCDFFEVGDAERAATDAPLEALVVERVALLVVER